MKHLIIEHLPKLRRFAYALTGSMADADDLVQNTIERILTNTNPVAQPSLNLIFTICKNLWIDEVRKRKVRRADEFLEADHSHNNSSIRSGNDWMETKELLNAIDALPDSAREVLSLVCVAGFSYAEAAETLNIPLGTVMSRVSRARSLLASRLHGAGDNTAHSAKHDPDLGKPNELH